jgi:uncharacterized protein (DUF1697 family)
MRYAALLRGINVGGNKKIAMAELRELLAGLGYADITTYLQSGNAVFSSPLRDQQELADAIAAAVAEQLGVSIRVVVRTGDELAAALRSSPLPGEPENPSRFFVAFLSAPPAPARIEALAAQSFGPDRVWVSGQEAYLWCPNGASQTDLTNAFLEKSLGVSATSRNWNTVTKLAGLTADG